MSDCTVLRIYYNRILLKQEELNHVKEYKQQYRMERFGDFRHICTKRFGDFRHIRIKRFGDFRHCKENKVEKIGYNIKIILEIRTKSDMIRSKKS